VALTGAGEGAQPLVARGTPRRGSATESAAPANAVARPPPGEGAAIADEVAGLAAGALADDVDEEV
jgi:hypothetical protein